jgi:hypothetical protein
MDYTSLYTGRYNSTQSLLWEPQNLHAWAQLADIFTTKPHSWTSNAGRYIARCFRHYTIRSWPALHQVSREH